MKNTILVLAVIAVFVSTILCIQSCGINEEESFNSNLESDELVDFAMSSNILFEKFLEYTNSLTDKDFEDLILHINDDEYISDIIQKAGIEKDIELVKENQTKLLSNKEYMSLNIEEQTNLFKHYSNKRQKVILKTKGEDSANDECTQRKLDDYAWAQAIADVGVISCTCAIEVPFAACACYVAVMLNYANSIRQADRAYEDCVRSM